MPNKCCKNGDLKIRQGKRCGVEECSKSSSTSNLGTLPSQTVTNPRQQINAITTRSGKTLEEPSTPLVPKPVTSNPQQEPEQNPETIIMNKVPEKLEDPRKFLIPCALQEFNRTSALADSGASINLLPHSIYKKLELEALTPTRMTLELANRSITHPMGIAEDVVVRVDGGWVFTFLSNRIQSSITFSPRSDPLSHEVRGEPNTSARNDREFEGNILVLRTVLNEISTSNEFQASQEMFIKILCCDSERMDVNVLPKPRSPDDPSISSTHRKFTRDI
ncbi:reverse transcriptase domain-containing protein [Tanacetum coccineum]